MAPAIFPGVTTDGDFGDLVISDDECEVESDAEPLRWYGQGLCCPLHIGEVLDGRYRIEHKLGWGGFSTVWLAHDIQTKKAVALKVAVHGERGEQELAMQKEILCVVKDTSNLAIFQASFDHPGPSSKSYAVLVLPVRGPSLDAICLELPAAFRVPAARSLLLGLKSLHDAGIIHGDLNGGAVLWNINPIDHLTTAEKYQSLGRPRKVRLTNAEGLGELVESIQFRPDMLRHPVTLCDFGHAIKSGTWLENTAQLPDLFCAPERLHGIQPSFASDIWGFTCLFTKLYLGVEAFLNSGPTLMSIIVIGLGIPFPEHWKGQYGISAKADDFWYDHSRPVPNSFRAGIFETLKRKLERVRPDACEEEREHALSIMYKGFCYEPEQRITAAQLLEDPSFTALMAYYDR